MTALPLPSPHPISSSTPAQGGVAGSRRLVLLTAIVLTNLGALGVTIGFPLRPGLSVLSEVQPVRETVWLFLSLAAVNLVVGVTALALAGLLLTPSRGSRWGTTGSGLMLLGAALYGVGVSGWAAGYFIATDPVALDAATASALLDRLHADPGRLWALPGGGSALVALGTVALSVGLWRAESVPRWVPVVASGSILATFVLPVSGGVGLLVEAPVAVSSIAIGWYAFRGRY